MIHYWAQCCGLYACPLRIEYGPVKMSWMHFFACKTNAWKLKKDWLVFVQAMVLCGNFRKTSLNLESNQNKIMSGLRGNASTLDGFSTSRCLPSDSTGMSQPVFTLISIVAHPESKSQTRAQPFSCNIFGP